MLLLTLPKYLGHWDHPACKACPGKSCYYHFSCHHHHSEKFPLLIYLEQAGAQDWHTFSKFLGMQKAYKKVFSNHLLWKQWHLLNFPPTLNRLEFYYYRCQRLASIDPGQCWSRSTWKNSKTVYTKLPAKHWQLAESLVEKENHNLNTFGLSKTSQRKKTDTVEITAWRWDILINLSGWTYYYLSLPTKSSC